MPWRYSLLIVATIVGGLWFDRFGGPWGQPLVSLWAWAVFLLLVLRSSPYTRIALIACLLIAAVGEVVLSMVWGLYDYRLRNIPLFVPPGHVLLYVLGTVLAVRLPRWVFSVIAIAAGVSATLLALSGKDLLSLPLTLLFLASLRFGPAPRLYGTMFALALAMELWGTWLGNWAWRAAAPGLGWATLNPPLAAGAFYCVLDWLVGLAASRSAAAKSATAAA